MSDQPVQPEISQEALEVYLPEVPEEATDGSN